MAPAELPEDRRAFFDVRDFGTAALVSDATITDRQVDGIFDDPSIVADVDLASVSSFAASFTCRSDLLLGLDPATMQLVIDGVTWYAKPPIEDDGTGISVVPLRQTAPA